MTVDVARGVSKDYSAFVVLDVSQMPFKVVAKYRNNDIKPLLFPPQLNKLQKDIITHMYWLKQMTSVNRLQKHYNLN